MGTIYYNGRVYLGQGRFAEAFSVQDSIFTFIGTSSEALSLKKEDDNAVDLEGRFVCAGFNDSHMHLLNYGQVLSQAPLYLHTSSLEDMLSCLKDHLEKHPPKGQAWLRGRGWNQDYFEDTDRMPTRRDLDKVCDKIPIMITRACGHCCVLNSKALEKANITAETRSPEGGSIGMENGVPDGRLFDNAMDLLLGAMPDPDTEELKDMIRRACRELNKYGVTSSQTDDYCVFRKIPEETVNEAYRQLESAGELTVRVYEQCNFTDPKRLKRFIETGNVTGKGTDMFRIGPLKLLGDGALGSRTAHLSRPYRGGAENGFSLFKPEEMKELVSIANKYGMQVAVHAIGDACLDTVLDSIESALEEHPGEDHRHGIVHCQVTRRDQLERIARLKLHVYAQSIFLDYDNHIAEKLIPEELYETSYSWKTLMDMGVSVSNGSDCPVELPDVMKGIECAVTRRSMDGTGPYLEHEAFSVGEAIDSFTIRSAEASFEETKKGRIAKGFIADFVILGEDPFVIEPSRLHSIPVLETYIGGRRVFGR